MPIKPVMNLLHLPVETEDDVQALLRMPRTICSEPSRSKRESLSRDLGDHFAYLAGVKPELFRPFQGQLVELPDDELKHVGTTFLDLVPLLHGAPDACVDVLVQRLERNPGVFWVEELLAAIGTPYALAKAANYARAHGKVDLFEHLGLLIPNDGAAEWRFTPRCLAMFTHPLPDGRDERLLEESHPIGLPLPHVLQNPEASAVTWHYVSVTVSQIPGVPSWPGTRLHLVSPRVDCDWTMYFRQDEADRYMREHLVVEEEEDDWEYTEKLRESESATDQGYATLRPFDDSLVFCNGHIVMTEGVAGHVGGPPIGLYPNPKCIHCGRLMFHVLSIPNHIREFGTGFRSVYLCERCHVIACTATSWN